jgi:RHS repeat-associated protein
MLRAARRGLSKRRTQTGPSKTLRRRSRMTHRLRLGIEVLEQRQMLSPVTWTDPNGGDWDEPSSWSTGQIPGPSDDVVIPATGHVISVDTKVPPIHSLTTASPILIFQSDGLSIFPYVLDIGGDYVPGDPIPRGSLSATAPITLVGGILADADVQAGTNLTIRPQGGGLSNVSLHSSLSIVNTTVTAYGELTLADGAQINVGASGELDLAGATVDGTGNIVLGSGTASGQGGTMVASAPTDTLSSGMTVHGPQGMISTTSGALINQSTIEPDPGDAFTVGTSGGGSWTNETGGILNGNGGTLTLGGNWSNSGELEATSSTVTLGGNWSNTGQFVMNNSTLNLGGNFTTAAGPHSITATGGSVNLTGTLNNTGSTLLLDAATGSWNLAGGTLEGGALETQDGSDLETTYFGGTLDGLTLGATIAGQAQPGLVHVATGAATVTGGLTLADAGVLQINAATNLPMITFQGNQAVSGNGQVQFAGRGGLMQVLGNLTLDPGVTLHGMTVYLTVGSGSLINQGTIAADGGGTIYFDLLAGASWTNASGGMLQAAGGSTVYFDSTSATWTNAAGGILNSASGGDLHLDGTWSNSGSIVVQNATIDLGGSFTTAGLGNYTRTGGTINLTGTMDNTGATLILDASTGPWNLEGGTLKNGALATLDGTDLETGISSGTLDGLTLGAIVAGQAQPGNLLVATGSVTVKDGLTLANGSVVTIAAASFQPLFNIQGNQAIGGTGQIQFAGNGGEMQFLGNVTLGPGITVHGTNGTINIQTGSLVNQGTIDSDAGGTLSIQGATGTSWSSTGLITSKNSTMELGGFFRTSTMGTIDGTQGFVGIAGTLTNDIPLALTDATGTIVLDGGTINGGLVTTSGLAELLVKGGGTLNGVTLQGTLDDSLFGSGVDVTITNGLTLVGSTIKLAGTNSLAFAGNEALSGTGTVTINSMGAGAHGLYLQSVGASLTIASGITITGHGFVGSVSGGSVTMDGTIDANDGGTLAVQGCTNLAGGTLTGGTWEATNNSTLEIVGTPITTNAASILLSGPQSHVYSDDLMTPALSMLAANAAGGQLTVTGGASLADTASLTNAGALTLGPNSSLTVGGYIQTGGSTSLLGGTLATVPHAGVNIQAGTFSGPGSVTGDLTNAANLDLGTGLGILNVTGNYTQTATGSLTVALGGTAPGTQYDQLSATATANLGGTLDIKLVNGFGPTAGQTFQVLSFAASNGNFATLSGLAQSNQTLLQPIFNPNNLTLQTIATAPDLVAANVTVQAGSAIAGLPITVDFTIKNQGGADLSGGWVDSVFLSSITTLDASAVLIGQVQHAGGLAVNGSYQGTLTTPLPGVVDGNYHVLVEADSQKLVLDSNRSNNVVASPALSVSIPGLGLGAPVSGTIASGEDLYYRVTVPPGDDVRLAAQFTDPSQADFLVSSFQIPTLSAYDQVYPTPADLAQQLVLPGSQPGTDYILLHGRQAAGGGEPFTIEVTPSPLDVQSYVLQAGPGSLTTLMLVGAAFTPQTTVRLLDQSSTAYLPASVTFVDSTHVSGAFDLNTVPPGTYQVQAVDGATVATAPTPYENVISSLQTSVTLAARDPGVDYVPVGGGVTLRLNVRNQSANNVIAPIIQVSGTNVALNQNPLTIYPFGGGDTGGLLPFIGPHASTRVQVSAPIVPAQAGVGGSLTYGTVDLQAPINWIGEEQSLRPSSIAPDAWDAIYANLTQALGQTPATVQQVMFNDSLDLSQLGDSVTSADQLMGFELMKADDELPSPTLSVAVDDSLPAPGLALTFQRTYVQALEGRYRLGTLGRGWVSNWDISVSTDATGVVTIYDAGQNREFTPVGDGTYQAAPGDFGALTQSGNTYQLREKDGTVTAFLPDGQLNYIEDPNGNRIKADYTAGDIGGLLESLTDSDGDSLTITYNAEGRISQVTDSAGRATTYTYDAAGDYLLSVTNPAGTTQYTYFTVSNIEQQHALKSITFPDGTDSYFSYDALGRLSQESGDNGAGQLTFSYFDPGGYTVTDANGDITKILYDMNGEPAQTTDPLGNISQVRYDVNGQPTLIGLVGGPIESFAYDAQGNVNRVVDPLGNASQFSYNPLYSSLQDYVDPLDNTTSYQQDGQGNPLGITYADDSSDQYTPDAQGNIAQAVDPRGLAVSNAYNSRGQIVDETFSDGTHTDFTYDSHGNLATATDAAGTTTLDYDDADRLTKITYPDGQFLEYTYDSGGRRSSMTDQTGFIVNYHYDTAGRLSGMTDALGNLIVQYDYDGAGQLVREDMGNGTYTKYAYDLAGNLRSLINYAPGGSVNSYFDYTYDAQGLRTTMTTLQGSTTYGYNAAGELTSAILPGGRTITYAYDAMGNRTVVSDSGASTDYTTNSLNQYTSVGGATYEYDAAGNLQVVTGPGGGTIYTYDSQDRLLEVQTATDTWTYQYDALGNRITTTHNGQTTHDLVDPFGMGNVVGEFDGSGNLMAHYTVGLGLTSQVDASNTAAYYNFDASGNTVGLTGQAGASLATYSYLPFGEILSATGTIANPFQFNGQWGVMADGTGLDFMRARDYSPTIGRFVSRDPIGLSGGANLYAFANNSPVAYQDPTGHHIDFGSGFSETISGILKLAPQARVIVASPAAGLYAAFAAEVAILGLAIYYNRREYQKLRGIENYIWTVDEGVEKPILFYAIPPGKTERSPYVYKFGGTVGAFQIAPLDPNFISGQSGYGPQGFVNLETSLPYQIAFENEPDATAPAQTVTVTQQLDPSLDWSTFQLGDFGFGGQTYSVPDGRQFYSTRIDARRTVGVFVDVTASFDEETGLLTWTFKSIDPTTMDQPTGNLLEGFLPPDKTAPQGQGWVSYFVQPRTTDPTGTAINAQASVIFDNNTPIDTMTFVNTIDAGNPTSNISPLPALTTTPLIPVSWSGSDDAGGSGIATYDIYVSTDGGPFTSWLLGTTLSQSTYLGQSGHSYAFYSVATDNVGNVQPTPAAAQTSISVQVPQATSVTGISGGGTYGGAATLTATLIAGGTGPAGEPISFAFNNGVTLTPLGTATTDQNGVATLTGVNLAGIAAGTYTGYVSASFAGDSSSAGSSGSGDLTVGMAPLTVSVNPATKTYGDSDPSFSASYAGFVSGDGPGNLGGALLFSTTEPTSSHAPVGTYTISPSGLTSSNYNLAYVDGTLAVTPRGLTVTAGDASKTYGAANPSFTYALKGFVPGEDAATAGITGSPALGTTATQSSGVGTYAITVAVGSLTAANYDFPVANLVDGTLTITAAPLMVTANDAKRVYGQPNPAFTAGYSGFVLGQDPAVLGGSLTFTTSTTTASHVQADGYPIIPGGLTSTDYAIAFVNGTLTIAPAPLTITANSQTMTYGGPPPALTASYSGFVNGDTAVSLTTPPTFGTTATAASHVAGGPYPITASGAADPDYTISYVSGTLAITSAPLTIAADDVSTVYGAPLPTFTATYTGLANGDTPAIFAVSPNVPPTFSITATAGSPVGSYPITPGGAADPDYRNSYVDGTLTIARDPTTTAASASPSLVGQAVALTATITANAPGSGTPTGSVDFFDTTTSTDLGSVGLTNGTAALNATGLPLGTQTITVSYGGDGNFLGSSSTINVSTLPSIYVLNPSASGALTLSGNAAINIPGIVAVDSSSKTAVSAAGNSRLTASAIDVVGGVQQTGGATFHPTPTTNLPTVTDPLGGLQPPGTTGLTSYGSVKLSGNSQQTISPGIYSQISASGNAVLMMSAGDYLIEGGGFTVTGNATVSGTGVMIYNAGSNYPGTGGNFGGITLSGNGTFSVTAATTGTYANILFFQSRQDTRALSISGNAIGGMTGVIYAANALLSMSGNASLANPLDVGLLNLSGNVALTQIAAGSGGAGDASGIANTLLAGNLSICINDPSSLFTSNELARVQNAVNAWDAILAPYNVTLSEVSDPTQANIVIDTGNTSACGSAANGVLGCYNASKAEITMLQGWNWYAGADPSQIGPNQYDFETTVLHELGHALGLGGSTNPSSPMYESLASGVADRTPTTQDLNIPDPPDGADPQMAAGFVPGSAAMAPTPNARAAAPVAVGIPGPAGFMALPSARNLWSAVSGQWPASGVPTRLPVGPEPTLVIEGPEHDNGCDPRLTRPDAEELLDVMLADLVTGADPSHGEEADGNSVVTGLPGAGEVKDATELERISSDGIDPTGFSRPVELPPRVRSLERGLIRMDVISDAMLDELAAAVVRSPCRLAVSADSIARPECPPEPGKGLAKLAATLIVAGTWCHRDRFRRVTTRPARTLRYRKESE